MAGTDFLYNQRLGCYSSLVSSFGGHSMARGSWPQLGDAILSRTQSVVKLWMELTSEEDQLLDEANFWRGLTPGWS